MRVQLNTMRACVNSAVSGLCAVGAMGVYRMSQLGKIVSKTVSLQEQLIKKSARLNSAARCATNIVQNTLQSGQPGFEECKGIVKSALGVAYKYNLEDDCRKTVSALARHIEPVDNSLSEISRPLQAIGEVASTTSLLVLSGITVTDGLLELAGAKGNWRRRNIEAMKLATAATVMAATGTFTSAAVTAYAAKRVMEALLNRMNQPHGFSMAKTFELCVEGTDEHKKDDSPV